MTHETRNFSDGSLFVHFEFFWQKELILLTKDDFFYCTMRFIPKIALNTKKRPVKVTSTTFLFREVEQLAVYQL